MFHDYVKINVKAGDGGHGMTAFRREKYVPLGGPAGGDGGRGGHVIITGDSNLKTLIDFKYRPHYKAAHGGNGGAKNMTGATADDLLLKAPLGTVVRDDAGNFIADIVNHGQQVTVAQGGRGGRGNSSFASGRNKAPEVSEKGEPGQERWLTLELKLLADVGLVGLPNAGKSTLISRVSSAKPKIADYPFTTLAPQLGLVRLSDEREFVMADLPGLIEGAATGIGLGHRFLRHAERCRLLVQVIDVSPQEERDVLADFKVIQEELCLYRADFAARTLIIAANKLDMPGAEENLARLRQELGDKYQILPVSALTGSGLTELLWSVDKQLAEAPPPAPVVVEQEIRRTVVRSEAPFKISGENGEWVVSGPRVEKLVAMTEMANEEAVRRMQRIFIKMGLEEALIEAGVQPGDTVHIAGMQFEYAE